MTNSVFREAGAWLRATFLERPCCRLQMCSARLRARRLLLQPPAHNTLLVLAADVIVDNRNDFLGQTRATNTFMLEYDFTKKITAHAGYRYERREITQRVSNTQVQTFFPGPT